MTHVTAESVPPYRGYDTTGWQVVFHRLTYTYTLLLCAVSELPQPAAKLIVQDGPFFTCLLCNATMNAMPMVNAHLSGERSPG